MSATTYDRAEFAALQATLADSWPQMTMRTTTGGPRTLVVLSSMSVEIPDYFDPLLTAYEERYLCLVLILARASNLASVIAATGVVQVTSIGNSPAEADALYDGAKRALRHAAS